MSLPVWLKVTSEGVMLSLKVQPRASRNEIGGPIGNELKVKVNAFREFGVLVPEGHRENSPAFQRWVEAGRKTSPGGTAEARDRNPVFFRPSGTLWDSNHATQR